jgi:hypothetical protein
MRGVLTSPLAADVLAVLEKVGPMPFRALACALRLPRERWDRLAKTVRALHAAGCASLRRAGGTEFVVPANAWGFRPDRQERLAWFAARLLEAGGRFEGGRAFFPKGLSCPVAVVPPDVEIPPGCVAVLDGFGKPPPGAAYGCRAEELKVMPLGRCLRRV